MSFLRKALSKRTSSKPLKDVGNDLYSTFDEAGLQPRTSFPIDEDKEEEGTANGVPVSLPSDGFYSPRSNPYPTPPMASSRDDTNSSRKQVRPSPSSFLVNIARSSTPPPDAYPSPPDEEDSFISTIRRQPPQATPIPDPYPSPLLTPPLGKGPSTRRKRRQQNSSLSMLQGLVEPPDPYVSETTAPEMQTSAFDISTTSMADRLQEAAKQARLKAIMAIEAKAVEATRKALPVTEPKPCSEEDFLDPEPPTIETDPPPVSQDDNSPSSNKDPEPSSSTQSSIDALQAVLDRSLRELQQAKEENHRLQVVQAAQERNRVETSLAPASSARPPLSASDAEVILLRTQLKESQDRIDSLSEEKLRIVLAHEEELRDQEVELAHHRERIMNLSLALDKANTTAQTFTQEKRALEEEMDDLVQRLKYQVEENQLLEEEVKGLQKERIAVERFMAETKEKEAKYRRQEKEKSGWRAQIDAMQQRLSDVEKKERCLDRIARQKYEARQEGAYGHGSKVARSSKLKHSPHVKEPSTDVMSAVHDFNEEVLQTANLLVEYLDRDESKPMDASQLKKGRSRATDIWGERVTILLGRQASDKKPSEGFNLLLLQNCLEVFVIHWASHIIEGWYPHQPSFSDILIELASQNTSSNTFGGQQICGKQIQVIRTGSSSPDYKTWVKEIINDLADILRVAGLKMIKAPSQPDLFTSKFLSLVKKAYDLRLAFAERDICGGLELAVPSPDIPFNSKFMVQDSTNLRSSRTRNASTASKDWTEMDSIAGTNAVGLKRTVVGQPGVYEMPLKPRVTSVQALEASTIYYRRK